MNYEPYNQFSWKASDYATVQSSEFGVTVHITDRGFKNKINAIKAVREQTCMGLKEAKDLVDSLFILREVQKRQIARDTATKLFNEAVKVLLDAGVAPCLINEQYTAAFDKQMAA